MQSAFFCLLKIGVWLDSLVNQYQHNFVDRVQRNEDVHLDRQADEVGCETGQLLQGPPESVVGPVVDERRSVRG